MSSNSLLERILPLLEGVEAYNGSYKALCPAHDDHNPSLNVKEVEVNGQKRVLIRCWVGCDTETVLEKLGLEWKDLFSENGSRKPGRIVATYDYTDPDGVLLHQTVRFEPKRFAQRRPDGKGGWEWNLKGIEPVLFRLPQVLEARQKGETVYILEGEKDCDRAREELGVTATTCPMGAGKWRESYTEALRGAHVVLVPDNDEVGRGHMRKVAENLQGVAASVKIVSLPGLPEKGDLSDWLDAGGTRGAFDDLLEETPQILSARIEEGFGRKAFLPVKSVSEIFAESEREADWKVRGLLARGSITDLSGEAKLSGKTTLTLHMIERLINGEDFLGFPTKECKVLYLTEQANNFAVALLKAGLEGADGKLFIVQQRDVWDVPWGLLVGRAVEACKRLGAEVLVIDTFAAFSEIAGTEENNSGDIHKKMSPLKNAAQVHGLAVLYLRHAGKSGRARGSSQFEAEGDIILSLKRPEGNQEGNENARVLEGVGRFDEIPRKLAIELTDDGYVALGSGEQVQFGKAVELVKDRLPSAPAEAMTQEELLEDLKDKGASRTTMQRALTWLIEQQDVREEGKGVKGDPRRYWAPPPATPPDPEQEIHSAQTQSPNGRNESEGDEGEGTGGFVTDPEHLVGEVVPTLQACQEVALDIETTDLGPFEGKVRVISLNADGKTYLLDCFAVDPTPALEAIKDTTLYIHNAEFDLPFLYHSYGFRPTETPIDTLHLSQVVRAGEWEAKEGGGWERKKHSLDEALRRELGVSLGEKEKFQKGEAWTGNLTQEHAEYAANDVIYLKPLAERLFALLKERKLEETWKLEQRAKPLFLEMCYRGIPFDKERWDRLVGEVEDRCLGLKERADSLAPPHPEGGTFNWFSDKQAKEAFELAGLKIPNLQRATLSKYDDPLVKAVSEYRDTRSELSRVSSWYQGRHKDGRIHPHWKPCGAATGRASCTDPNVQSLAKEGGYRSCIRP